MPGTSLIEGDCLEMMRGIGNDSVDMVFADLPYGVTQNRWDVVIPFEPLWDQLLRVGKKNCAFVFTATQPFATSLISSQPKLFRYDLVWEKQKPSGFMNAGKRPLSCHEHVLIFSQKSATYNNQKIAGYKPYKARRGSAAQALDLGTNYGKCAAPKDNDGTRHPRSVLRCESINERTRCHPTQKPVALLEWLIKSYSNEGDLILDPTMGSGTTGVSCRNTGRHFIGIEKDPTYFEVARKRIETTPRPVV